MTPLVEKKRKPKGLKDWNTEWKAGKDKLWHFLANIGIVASMSIMGVPLVVAVLVAIFVSVGKEVYDAYYGNPDWWDLVCDGLGILAGVIIVLGLPTVSF